MALPPTRNPMRILLLCDCPEGVAGTIIDHVRSFTNLSRHHYVVQSGRGNLLADIDLSAFDGIVIHYSLVACYDSYLAPETRRKIRTFQGYKAAFVQDDYRFINATVATLHYMQIHALFALAGPDIIDQVYAPDKLPDVHKVTVLTGYVPDTLIGIPVPTYDARPMDVCYRARKLPAWIGSHTLQKWQIADKFTADAARYGLNVDISYREEDRIYGEAWTAFMTNTKAVLGTESGASICDFTGEIQRNVERHTQLHPKASFEELRDLYFKNEDGRIMMNVISPRCFEAAALRTLMIMYEGDYSGIMKPWKHYVPLKFDHSNMEEVVAIVRDSSRAQAIIESAYDDLIASGRYSYHSMMTTIDQAMQALVDAGLKPSPKAQKKAPNAAPKGFITHVLALLRWSKYGGTRIVRSVRFRAYHALGRYPHTQANVRRIYMRARAWLARLHRFASRKRRHFPRIFSLYDTVRAWLRMRGLQRFFVGKTDTMVHLYVTPTSHTIDIVALPIGTAPLPSSATPLTLAELSQWLAKSELHTLRWTNNDTIGLGVRPPLNLHYVVGAHLNIEWMKRLLRAEHLTWVDAIYLSSHPIANPHGQ
jgi:hypothetical protein